MPAEEGKQLEADSQEPSGLGADRPMEQPRPGPLDRWLQEPAEVRRGVLAPAGVLGWRAGVQVIVC